MDDMVLLEISVGVDFPWRYIVEIIPFVNLEQPRFPKDLCTTGYDFWGKMFSLLTTVSGSHASPNFKDSLHILTTLDSSPYSLPSTRVVNSNKPTKTQSLTHDDLLLEAKSHPPLHPVQTRIHGVRARPPPLLATNPKI